MLSRTMKTGLIGFSQLIVGFGSLIATAIIVRVLSESDYATYRQALLVYTTVTAVLGLGLPKAVYYFLPGEKSRSRNIVMESQLFLFIMAILFGLFILCGGNKLIANGFNNPDLESVLIYVVPYTLFLLPLIIATAVLMSKDKPKQVVAITFLQKFVFLSLIIPAALIFRTVPSLMIANIVFAFIMFIISEWMMFSACPEYEPGISLKKGWDQLVFSIPLGMASIIGTLNLSLDKLVVSSMTTPQEFAIYINGAMEIPLVPILISSVGMVILPDLTNLFKQGKKTEMVEIWKNASSKTALILVPVFFLLMFTAEDFIVTLYSEKYLSSTLPFRIYLFLLLIRIVNTDAPLIASGRSKLVLKRVVISLSANLILNIFLVWTMGYIGAAISTVVVIILWSLPFTLYHIAKISDLSLLSVYPFKRIGKVAALSIFASVIFCLRFLLMDIACVLRLGILCSLYSIIILILYDRFSLLSIASILGNLKKRMK